MVSYTFTMVAFVFQTRNPCVNCYYTSIMITRITLAWENHIKHYRVDISGPVLARMSANILLPALNVFVTSPVIKSWPVSYILYQYHTNDFRILRWTL